jgi:hypothetical protein
MRILAYHRPQQGAVSAEWGQAPPSFSALGQRLHRLLVLPLLLLPHIIYLEQSQPRLGAEFHI